MPGSHHPQLATCVPSAPTAATRQTRAVGASWCSGDGQGWWVARTLRGVDNPWLTFALIALATYRICAFVIDDHLAEPITNRVQVFFEKRWLKRHPGEVEGEKWQSKMAFLLSCYWCLSVWVAGFMVLIVDLWVQPVTLPVLVVLAASGVTGFVSTAESAMSGDEH